MQAKMLTLIQRCFENSCELVSIRGFNGIDTAGQRPPRRDDSPQAQQIDTDNADHFSLGQLLSRSPCYPRSKKINHRTLSIHMNGKISHLPKNIREQLNRRLDDGERHNRILGWLNSLPEVRALVVANFASRPISKQNLYEWTQHSFRHWKIRENALAFASEDLADASSSDACSTANLTEKLVQWLALRFAASAHTILPADGEPETALRSLRQLAADIIALRRGDLYSRRVALEEQRLALQATQAKEAREEEFWEWAERPDIREHLEEQIEAQLEERRAWHDTLRAAAPEIAPYMPKRPQPSPVLDETLAPAALI